MDKDKLLDLLVTNKDLWTELMNTDDLAGFTRKHRVELREIPGYANIEKSHKTPFEQVADAFDTYTDLPEVYISDKAKALGLKPDEVKSILNHINSLGISYSDKQRIANEYMKQMSDRYARQKAVDEYQHSYFGMDASNPINKALNTVADFIISDDTKKAVIDEPNNTARIAGNIAADIGGTGADFLLGAGGTVAGPAIRAVRNIAEGKDIGTIAHDAAWDIGGNVVLSKGIKGIPGLGDLGPIRNIEERLPMSDYYEQYARSKTKGAKIPEVPKLKTYADGQEWIMKTPSEYRPIFQEAFDKSKGSIKKANLEGVRETLEETRKQVNREASRAKDWVKKHPVKATSGVLAESGIIGVEKTGARAGTDTDTEYKIANPDKATKNDSADYDKTIDYIIENNKRMWDAGFVPRGGIELEAYGIYKMGAKKPFESAEYDILKAKPSFTDFYNGL